MWIDWEECFWVSVTLWAAVSHLFSCSIDLLASALLQALVNLLNLVNSEVVVCWERDDRSLLSVCFTLNTIQMAAESSADLFLTALPPAPAEILLIGPGQWGEIKPSAGSSLMQSIHPLWKTLVWEVGSLSEDVRPPCSRVSRICCTASSWLDVVFTPQCKNAEWHTSKPP